MARTTAFSHLLNLPRRLAARGAKADDDGPVVDDYNNDDPLDEQYAEDEDDKPKGRKAKRAEDKKDDADAEDDDDGADAEDEDDKPKGKRASRARRAEDDDDKPDAEDEDDKKPDAARASERARCAQIMAYGMNHGMAPQAFALAFDSNVSRATAISVLKANQATMPKRAANASTADFHQAMSQLGVTQVAPEASRALPAGADAVAAMIIKAGQ